MQLDARVTNQKPKRQELKHFIKGKPEYNSMEKNISHRPYHFE